jgi:hypothetical protein
MLLSGSLVWVQSQAASPPSLPRFDLWLRRFSQIAQVAMVALTLWTIVYTVIPLYQKAALDEAMARTEAELRAIKMEAGRVYIEMRSYVAERLIDRIGAECTGLMIPPAVSGGPDTEEQDLAIDVNACAQEQLRTSIGIRKLRPVDAQFLAGKIGALGATLETEKAQVRRDFASFYERAKLDPSLVQPVAGKFTLAAARIVPASQRNAWLANAAIDESRSRMLLSFEGMARERIRALDQIEWPSDGEK